MKLENCKKCKKKAQENLNSLETIINKMKSEVDETEEDKKYVKNIQIKIDDVKKMRQDIDETKKGFLNNLLEEVNHNASLFFRGVVRTDDPRLYAIEVDSDYKLNFKNRSSEILEPSTISKGNTQIALMSFFFGLSKYLKHKLPYIIDDPLIRLDPGHDKRLINYLCSSEQQIIMHMIPGKEYNVESFQWLKPFINTQNWINRIKTYSWSNKLQSTIQKKNTYSIVEYDIDKL